MNPETRRLFPPILICLRFLCDYFVTVTRRLLFQHNLNESLVFPCSSSELMKTMGSVVFRAWLSGYLRNSTHMEIPQGIPHLAVKWLPFMKEY